MTNLYLAAGMALLLIGSVIAIYLAGRRAGVTASQAASDAATVEVQKKQLDDSTLPRDKASVEDSLRKGAF